MSCPNTKNPRQNLSLDLCIPPTINSRERNRLTHSNSICLPLTNRSIPRHDPVSSEFLLANHAKVEPSVSKGSCESVMTSDTMLSSQASFGAVSAMEVTGRISSSSESEEDIEGWLVLNERPKPWPEVEPKRVSIQVYMALDVQIYCYFCFSGVYSLLCHKTYSLSYPNFKKSFKVFFYNKKVA